MGKYYANGKEVLLDAGLSIKFHVADVANVEGATLIAKAMNSDKAITDYISDALTTLSPSWHGNLVSKAAFSKRLNNAIDAGERLDAVKKSLFYGRNNNFSTDGLANIDALPDKLNFINPQNAANIIHGVIGVYTEASELLEALRNWLNAPEKGFDYVNMREEIGDLFWYVAILLHEASKEQGEGFTFEDCMRINIEKLKARFSDKFEADNANNRDLTKERKILED